MRIDDFVLVDDVEFEGRSLIEQVLGVESFVDDDALFKLTTAHNLNLLQEARAMIENRRTSDSATLLNALRQLGSQAETVLQGDCEQSRAQQARSLDPDDCFDYAQKAGCLD